MVILKGMGSCTPGSSTVLAHVLSIYLSILSQSFSDHYLRCGGWSNLEFNKRENIQDGPLKLFTRSISEAC